MSKAQEESVSPEAYAYRVLMEHEHKDSGIDVYAGPPLTIEGITYYGFKIDRMDKFANPWRIQLLIDRVPSNTDFVYDIIEPQTSQGTRLLYAVNKGLVSFFAHNPNRPDGYGGAEMSFAIKHPQGIRTEQVRGPWSSRASIMNTYIESHGDHCIEAEFRILNPQSINSATAVSIRGVTMRTMAQILRHFHQHGSPDHWRRKPLQIVMSTWDEKSREFIYGISDKYSCRTTTMKYHGKQLLAVIDPNSGFFD